MIQVPGLRGCLLYDYQTVGAGSAGIFRTLELIDCGIRNVLVIDMGKDIARRDRRGKDLLCGRGGAGAFSDAKILLSPDVGGFLGDLLDHEHWALGCRQGLLKHSI